MIFADKEKMEKEALDKKALEMLKCKNLRDEGKRIRLLKKRISKKKQKYIENGTERRGTPNTLKDKIDVTAFMLWFIENYPETFKEMKENQRI